MGRGTTLLVLLTASGCVEAFDTDPNLPDDELAFRGAEVEYLPAASPAGVATRPLQAGVPYRVVIDGTVSVWKADDWSRICAGRPYSAPRYPSPGTSGPVGLDAEWVWAWTSYSDSLCPNGAPSATPPVPRRLVLYQPRPGAPFQPLPPPSETGMSPRHEYTYSITGTGAPAAFVVDDKPIEDNYGALRIRILPQ